MDVKKVKKFRTKINISISRAIELLKKYDNDILKCKEELHNENIKTIFKITECDEKTAKENYLKYKYNIEKAIKSINNKGVILAVEESKVKKFNKIYFIS